MSATKAAPKDGKGMDKLLRGLSLTKEGRVALEAAELADALLEERRAAHRDRSAAIEGELALPALAARAEETAKRLAEETERLTREHLQARHAHSDLASRISTQKNKAEALLEHTADPLVKRASWALREAMQQVRRHVGLDLDRQRQLLATFKATPARSDEEALLRNLKTAVRLADRALEILPALEDALDAVEALKLEVAVDPAEVRQILEDCPTLAPDDKPLHLLAALADDVPLVALR